MRGKPRDRLVAKIFLIYVYLPFFQNIPKIRNFFIFFFCLPQNKKATQNAWLKIKCGAKHHIKYVGNDLHVVPFDFYLSEIFAQRANVMEKTLTRFLEFIKPKLLKSAKYQAFTYYKYVFLYNTKSQGDFAP